MNDSARRRILYVEDDEMVRRSILRAMRGSEYEFVSAGTIAEASCLLDGIDAAVVDNHLPDGDGVRFATSLRDRGLPVLVASGSLAPAGSDLPWLVKPFRASELGDRLDQLLG